MMEIEAPTAIEDHIEQRRAWLKEKQSEYLRAKADVESGRETAQIVSAFQQARQVILGAEPKTGEEALYRLGQLREIFTRATELASFIAEYEASLETLKLLKDARRDRPFRGVFDSL